MLPYLRNTIVQKKKNKAKGKPFNPNFDGNLLAWYDGDTLATDPANTWSDRSTNNYDLTLVNAPTIINNAINGHDALQFDGVNQYGQVIVNQLQPFSFYVVFKQITWVNNDCIIGELGFFLQAGASPSLSLFSGIGVVNLNPILNLNDYGIVTGIQNGINSEIRNNDNAAVIGNPGPGGMINLNLCTNNTFGAYGNNEIAYLIIRNGADSTAVQNLFINSLKARFAL